MEFQENICFKNSAGCDKKRQAWVENLYEVLSTEYEKLAPTNVQISQNQFLSNW